MSAKSGKQQSADEPGEDGGGLSTNWGVMSQADQLELAAWRELSQAWQGQVNDVMITPTPVPSLRQAHWPMDVQIVAAALRIGLERERKQRTDENTGNGGSS